MRISGRAASAFPIAPSGDGVAMDHPSLGIATILICAMWTRQLSLCAINKPSMRERLTRQPTIRQGTFPNEAERLMVQKMPRCEPDEFGDPKPVRCHRVKLPVDVILRAGRPLSEKTSCAAVSREPPSQFNSYISDLQR
jgi:hypothetical protein